MNRAALRKQILQTAQESESDRFVCPACNGGSKSEASLTIWEGEDGYLRATCHRASCDLGTLMLETSGLPRKQRPPKSPNKKHLTITYMPMHFPRSSRVWDRWKAQYRFEFPRGVATKIGYVPGDPDPQGFNTAKAYAYPIVGPDYAWHGYVLRPLGNGWTKAYNSIADDWCGVSWYLSFNSVAEQGIFVVEDAPSALALWCSGHSAISLNGTALGRDRLDDILSYKNKIYLCLDADATRKALMYRLRYGIDAIQVRRLTQDVKDMTNDEVSELIKEVQQ